MADQPPTIALLAIGHPDYQTLVGEAMAAAAARALEARGVRVLRRCGSLLRERAAMQAAVELLGQDPDGVILFLGTWIEAPVAIAAVRELEHLPLAVWGFPMYEEGGLRRSTGSFVALSVVQGTLRRMGLPHAALRGMPDDGTALAQAVTFAQAAHARKRLRRARVGLVGYASMGMYPGTVDHVLLRRLVGPEVVALDTFTLVQRAEAADARDVLAATEEIRGVAALAAGTRPALLERVARLLVALRGLAADHDLDAVTVQCQYELSQEWGCTACVPLSLLSEHGLVCGCEADVPTLVTQLLLDCFAAEPVFYGDVLDCRGGEVLLSSCGFAPFGLAAPAVAPEIAPFAHPGFTGLMASVALRPGVVTIARLNEQCGGFSLLVTTGTAGTPQKREGLFPALAVQLDGDPQAFLDALESQHVAIAYGDHRAELTALARLLGTDLVTI